MAEHNTTASGAVRYEQLDWLRGLLALSILLYHLTTWDVTPLAADTLLGRLGVYGVSMFFVLSGLSIALAYHRSLDTANGVWSFGVRRVFRIWPLLWLAVFTITAIMQARGEAPGWRLVALNLTTLFGFVMPSAYLNAGAWSIGNEMVYYGLTPLIIGAYNRSLGLGNLVLAATAGVAAAFAFRWLNADATLAAQWTVYINPFNNLFLYVAGVALYFNTAGAPWSKSRTLVCMSIAVVVLAIYPVAGDQALIVTGVNRIVFCGASVLLVLAFYKSSLVLPHAVALALSQLGLATYGVYLLHPLVRELVRLALPGAGAAITAPLIVGFTLLVSWGMYHRFERPMMQLAKRVVRSTKVQAHAG